MQQKLSITLLIGVGILLGVLSMFVLPNGDDWIFLRNIEMDFRKDSNQLLKPEGLYWRPVQELIAYLMSRVPETFPYLQHFLAGFFNITNTILLYLVVKKAINEEKIAFVAGLFFLLCPMSMSCAFSIDSFAQIFANFCGIFATYIFVFSKSRSRYVFWILFCYIGGLTKETGLPWFFAVPIIAWVFEYLRLSHSSAYKKKLLSSFILNCVIASFFVAFYFVIRYSFFPDSLNFDTIAANTNPNNSYKLTPVVFLKNILILYIAPIIPVDTSALIYGYDFWIGLVTSLIVLPWIVFLYKMIKMKTLDMNINLVLMGMALLICIASPSLVTRAGELSAYPVIFVIAFLGSLIVYKLRISKKIIMASFIIFFITSLITDMHKYYLIFRAGKIGNEMALKTIKDTKVVPNKVLVITVDDYSDLKDGAMHVVPGTSFHQGDAVRWAYSYQYPKVSKKIMIKPHATNTIKNQIDSVLKVENFKKYNCVWINHKDNIKVINVK